MHSWAGNSFPRSGNGSLSRRNPEPWGRIVIHRRRIEVPRGGKADPTCGPGSSRSRNGNCRGGNTKPPGPRPQASEAFRALPHDGGRHDIDHTRTKAQSPLTNGICERFLLAPLHHRLLLRLRALAQIEVDQVLIRNTVLLRQSLGVLIVSSSRRIVSCFSPCSGRDCARISRNHGAFSSEPPLVSVPVGPGATTFTVIFRPRISFARRCVIASTPPFVAA
jgi:hypothetical protein